MADPCHSIRVVAQKTGLTPHVIRVWEKRYGAVAPLRTDTNRRLYSEEEIERLTLLREATHAGHSIGNIAKLSLEALRALVREALPAGGRTKPWPPTSGASEPLADLEDRCLQAIEHLDSHALEEALEKALLLLGHQGMLCQLAAPLAQRVGDLWRAGVITAAQEHFASAVLRVFLGSHSKPFALNSSAPCMVLATPVGQLHELGAVLVGAAAANLGWRVVYLGTSLPASEIASVAHRQKAKVVALSLVYPEDDPELGRELRALRGFLSDSIPLLVGGRAAHAYADVLESVQAVAVADLEELATTLEFLRSARAVQE